MKEIVRFILGLLAPFILIFGGGGLLGFGIEHDYDVLAWAGAIATLSGLLWGGWLLFLDGATTWWS